MVARRIPVLLVFEPTVDIEDYFLSSCVRKIIRVLSGISTNCSFNWRAKRAHSREVDENSVLPICPYLVACRYLSIYIRHDLKKRERWNGRLWKLTLDSQRINRLQNRRPKVRNWIYMRPAWLCCKGKVNRVLFWLNYSIHQHALALDVIQVLDGRNYFQSC